MAYDLGKFDTEIQKAVEWFTHEIASLRTGRAHPALVEDLEVESYGSKMPLKHVAAINVEDARTLAIKPWDKSTVQAIETAVRASSLGLQPVVDKDIIRIILPELTAERRTSLKKILKEKLEQAKIAVRRGRDDSWNDIQAKEREGTISEDDKFRLKDALQNKIDDAYKKLEEISAKKEIEIG